MDLIIKNVEYLKHMYGKDHKPLQQIVVDPKRAIEDDGIFIEFLTESCNKYVEAGESYLVPNEDSKPEDIVLYNEESENSYFKRVTEHMKSEFDVTGIDVQIFMENKVKYGGLLGKEIVDFINGEGGD